MQPLPVRLALAALLAAPAAAQVTPDAVMLRYPDVSADRIVFRYAGDLWTVPREGGLASRVTSAEGNESFAKFSPDGERLAFVAGYDGGSDLYTLEIDAGAPERVTYHPAQELLCDWMPDGEGLLYWSGEVSGNGRAARMLVVPAEGGQPEPLPVPYGTFGSVDPTGTWLAYTPRSREFRTWKRYQGGRAQDIWLFNLKTHEARRITEHPGTDAMPMWDGSRVIFLSDRGPSARLNLFAYDTRSGSTEQLTDFSGFDVQWPSVGPRDVVFTNGSGLYRYELEGRSTVEVPVRIPGDRPSLRAQDHDVSGLVGRVSSGPSGSRAAVEARGEIFDLPFGEGVTRNLTRTSGVAERYPSWSPDGKWIAYFSDRTGEYELTLRRSDGARFEGADAGGERTVTTLGAGWKYPAQWAPDSKSLVFSRSDGALHLFEVESGDVRELARSRSGQPLGVDWSRDSRWVLYSDRHPESRLQALHLIEVASGDAHVLTSGLFEDDDPCFSADRDWIYYRSARSFSPTYADLDTTWIYEDTEQIVAVPLRADVENPFAPEDPVEEIAGEEEEAPADAGDSEDAGDAEDAGETEAGGGDEDAEAGGDEEAEEGEESGGEEGGEEDGDGEDEDRVVIELEGLESRAILLDVEPGSYASLQGAKGGVAYLRSSGEGPRELVLFDLESGEEETVMSGVSSYYLLPGRDKAVVNASGDWGVISVAPGQSLDDTLPTDELVARVEPREEWAQILADAHRIMRDFFYDPGLHGVDWDGVYARYASALDDVTTRTDLHFLIGEMIGELNVGHAYNRTPPQGLPRSGSGRPAGLLGCDWSLEGGAYRIARILGGHGAEVDARSPLSAHGVDVAEGDYLLAVNGVPVDASRAVYAAFEGTAGRPTRITVNASPEWNGEEREVLVEPIGSESSLRYRAWVARNRDHVDQASGGRIGYVHVPDTGQRGQSELVRQYYGQMHKQALIIDERWNGGGQIPTRFIELLNRPLTNFWAVRSGEDWDWPPDGFWGPKAMLINESAGSGGDCFPYYFRQSGLGKLIGTRTWGGLVGISGNPSFVDGAGISLSLIHI